ncbi:hypothetical protein EWM64_g10389 [Hericium alpestre]|uniref:Uncharacterized protein n=1 Tax=Hericium alpestre TaxID=135208 RepID=A0A4Y9ZIF1_9AGAM|nr:hypothetical protein EWM64_g10389 [Hericium alpestre]
MQRSERVLCANRSDLASASVQVDCTDNLQIKFRGQAEIPAEAHAEDSTHIIGVPSAIKTSLTMYVTIAPYATVISPAILP